LTQETASALQNRHNLRHLRAFLAVADTRSASRAGEICNVSQPAITQAIAKTERSFGCALFMRTPQGLFTTQQGDVLAHRVRRAFSFLDPVLTDLSPRLRMVATASQLEALIAVREAENFTLAARRLGLAQPTVHRAVSQLEEEAARPLFERTSYGIVATRAANQLAQAARLAFAELAQAETDIAETRAEESGRIVIGAMPLSRSFVLPKAIAEFRKQRTKMALHVVEGPYAELLSGLRRGEIDFLIGALRDPAPIGDIVQRPLFSDTLVIVCGSSHPLASSKRVTLEQMASYPWIVGPKDTPLRRHFDALFSSAHLSPLSIVESSSLILMRELLDTTDHLGCISALQAQAELSRGLIRALPVDLEHTARPIGLTLRKDWIPTVAQAYFLELVEVLQGQADEIASAAQAP